MVYIGPGILLAGSVFAFFIAFKGFKSAGAIKGWRMNYFHQGNASPGLKKMIRLWMIIMTVGLAVTGAGISMITN